MTAAAPAQRPSAWLWAWGTQSWLIWVVGPRLYRDAVGMADLPWVLLPALVLAGAYTGVRTGSRSAVWIMLGAFPISLAAAVSNLDPQLALTTYAPAVLAAGSLSLLAYAATAAAASSQPASLRATTVQPLGESHLAATDPRRARAQAALLWGTSVALLGLVILGSWDTALRYHEAWGERAAGGATLVAVVAGLVGAVAMAAVVGPGLRAERPRGTTGAREARRLRRVIWLLSVAASGVVAYALLLWSSA